MKKVRTAGSEADLAVVRSLFDAEGVPHFVHNDSFGSLVIGPHIENYNVKSIIVLDEAEERARDLLSRFESNRTVGSTSPSARDRLRMILEAAFF